MATETKVTTPKGRLSWPYLAKPDVGRENSSNKYNTDLVIRPEDWAKDGIGLKIEKAVLDVWNAAFPSQRKDSPKLVPSTIKYIAENDQSVSEEIRGCIVLRGKNSTQPKVVDAQVVEMGQAQIEGIKSGDYAKLFLGVFSYNKKGNKGIAFGLNAVQFIQSFRPFNRAIDMSEASFDVEEIEVKETTDADFA